MKIIATSVYPVINKLFFSFDILTKFYLNILKKKKLVDTIENHFSMLEDADKVFINNNIDVSSLSVGLVRDGIVDKYVGYLGRQSYYPKYERFLKTNKIKYKYFDVHLSNWLEQSKQFNIVVWRVDSSPSELSEALQKIFILEQNGLKCLPSFKELFKYENKIGLHYFYKNENLPEIPTYVSYSKKESIEKVLKSNYPIVSKITTGAGSNGVELLKTKRKAIRLVYEVFGISGKRTYWIYSRQKNYVLFQKFIKNAEFDLRVIVVGNYLFGYYRYPNKGDFRASGSGLVVKKDIPNQVLDLAWVVKEKYGAKCLSTDFLYSKDDNKYLIIESSIMIGVDTPIQLEVNGFSGRYFRSKDGAFKFEKGKFWIQELTLKCFLED